LFFANRATKTTILTKVIVNHHLYLKGKTMNSTIKLSPRARILIVRLDTLATATKAAREELETISIFRVSRRRELRDMISAFTEEGARALHELNGMAMNPYA